VKVGRKSKASGFEADFLEDLDRVLDHRPLLVALAGPNGAGKTTFYQAHLRGSALRFLNADELSRELDIDAYEAAHVISQLRRELDWQTFRLFGNSWPASVRGPTPRGPIGRGQLLRHPLARWPLERFGLVKQSRLTIAAASFRKALPCLQPRRVCIESVPIP